MGPSMHAMLLNVFGGTGSCKCEHDCAAARRKCENATVVGQPRQHRIIKDAAEKIRSRNIVVIKTFQKEITPVHRTSRCRRERNWVAVLFQTCESIGGAT